MIGSANRFVCFLLICLLCALPAEGGEAFSGRVTKVFDGDTVEVTSGTRSRRVRLLGIDAPERDQPYGHRARQYASALAFGKRVRVEVEDTDRYGRTVGVVRLPDGRSLNREMVAGGYAWWYRRYSADSELELLERQARAARLGLWRDRNPLPPWRYREQQRETRAW